MDNGFGCAADGLLTYVQGVGFKPSSNPATSASTADFGVGVFLMACAETANLLPEVCLRFQILI